MTKPFVWLDTAWDNFEDFLLNNLYRSTVYIEMSIQSILLLICVCVFGGAICYWFFKEFK